MSHSFGIVRLGDEMDIDSESHGAGVTSDFIPWLTQVNHRSNHRQYWRAYGDYRPQPKSATRLVIIVWT